MKIYNSLAREPGHEQEEVPKMAERRKLEDRVALVTGANSGIGRVAVEALRGVGFAVYAGARRPEAMAELEADGFRALRLDVTDEESMVSAVATIESAHGAVDVLVNSAGYGLYGPMEEVSLDDLRDEFEVNVFGLLRMSQLVLPGMRTRGGGRILHIGSVGGLFTSPFSGAYHMSKYAVESLSDAMRAEVAGFGVEVALLEPTGVRTPFVHKQVATTPDAGPDSPYTAQKASGAEGAVALFRPGSRAVVDPEDVARVVVQAATARRPRTRYKVGMAARVIPVVRAVLPDRVWDRTAMRQFASGDGAQDAPSPAATTAS
jgi:NAD(P)-dependent dehydrogenase (short-subunit alcohol dehydrogenase family)